MNDGAVNFMDPTGEVAEQVEALAALSVEELLASLHADSMRLLLARVKAGVATAAELSVARALLKDNNITSIPKHDAAAQELQERLASRARNRKVPGRTVAGDERAIVAEAGDFQMGNPTWQ